MATSASTEALLTMTPPPAARRWVRALRIPYATPSRLTSITRRNSSGGTSVSVPYVATAALLTQASIRPKWPAARLASRSTAVGIGHVGGYDERLRRPAARHSSATAAQRVLPAGGEHDASAPRRASAIAVAAPIPLEAPVTTTTWSAVPRRAMWPGYPPAPTAKLPVLESFRSAGSFAIGPARVPPGQPAGKRCGVCGRSL